MNTPTSQPSGKWTALGEIFTDTELLAALKLFLTDRATFHDKCRDQVVAPAIERINTTLGKKNDPDYLAYGLEFALDHVVPASTNGESNGADFKS